MESKSEAVTIEEYLEQLPGERKAPMQELRKTLLKNLPKGFKEVVGDSMINYVVPHTIYPAGYHCDPRLPLGFISIASQKNYISLHHMGIYGNSTLSKWFIEEYNKISKTKLDMGKACIRFKKTDEIPFELIGELASKITPQKWVEIYESYTKK